jgi:O-methyltransferase
MVRLGRILSRACAAIVLAALVLIAVAGRVRSDRRNEIISNPGPAVPIAISVKTLPVPNTPEELYLDLLKRTLTRTQTTDRYLRRTLRKEDRWERYLFSSLGRLLGPRYEIVERTPAELWGYVGGGGVHLERRQEDAETMVGTLQLDNVQYCVTDVLKHKIPGDLMECGVWRGGVTIFMRAILQAYGDKEKMVWAADSFEGQPRTNYRPDLNWGPPGTMAASLDEVQENFARYSLLDAKVHFLKGYFNKTLPTAPIGKLSVLRADADLYDSQKDVLTNLYPKLSVGGYMIVDDYDVGGCKRAIDEYRKNHNITEEIKAIDTEGIYWQKLH